MIYMTTKNEHRIKRNNSKCTDAAHKCVSHEATHLSEETIHSYLEYTYIPVKRYMIWIDEKLDSLTVNLFDEQKNVWTKKKYESPITLTVFEFRTEGEIVRFWAYDKKKYDWPFLYGSFSSLSQMSHNLMFDARTKIKCHP